MIDETLLTPEQVAEAFKVTPQTIRNWIKKGMLPAERYGHVFRLRSEDVVAVLAGKQAAGATPARRGDVWTPQSLALPRRREGARHPKSVWDDAGVPMLVRKRS
ncbi:MAG TPA: helix-turn-helix domain-containing protein [Solirubrobacteraceae bacterium]|jgi:excisionase family DNA binding protein